MPPSFPAAEGGLPGGTLLLYDPPHILLSGISPTSEHPLVDRVHRGYRQLLECWQQQEHARVRLVAMGPLAELNDADISRWLQGEAPSSPTRPLAPPEPMAALVTIEILRMFPPLLEGFLNLERRADLCCGTPDMALPRPASLSAGRPVAGGASEVLA
jgi:hypothetical protein